MRFNYDDRAQLGFFSAHLKKFFDLCDEIGAVSRNVGTHVPLLNRLHACVCFASRIRTSFLSHSERNRTPIERILHACKAVMGASRANALRAVRSRKATRSNHTHSWCDLALFEQPPPFMALRNSRPRLDYIPFVDYIHITPPS
jgi:hypothetical protein